MEGRTAWNISLSAIFLDMGAGIQAGHSLPTAVALKDTLEEADNHELLRISSTVGRLLRRGALRRCVMTTTGTDTLVAHADGES